MWLFKKWKTDHCTRLKNWPKFVFIIENGPLDLTLDYYTTMTDEMFYFTIIFREDIAEKLRKVVLLRHY